VNQEAKLLSAIIILFLTTLVLSVPTSETRRYETHDPIIIENVQTGSERLYIIEGYEISNPDGPGIQVHNVNHVIIRNNYIHDCGTKISETIQEKVEATGDARHSMMRNPDLTGAINVLNAQSVEISGNRVVNNDYGIRVWNHSRKAAKVEIDGNVVLENHRSFFVSVCHANNVAIHDNVVKDNGLSLFIDNEALIEAFAHGKDYGDGRSSGIVTDGCSNVRIYGNTVINSRGDGILVSGESFHENLDKVADNIEVYGNTVIRNAEQGILFSSARRGKVYGNTIKENTARSDTTGGSRGILFEANVLDFEVYDNEVSYNDMYGILITLSTDISIHDNQIHHNGDGAIGWGKFFHPQADTFEGMIFKKAVVIAKNNIHHNRIAVFGFLTDKFLDNVIVKNNTFSRNGGNPIHYEQYVDHTTSTHPQDWEYDGVNAFWAANGEDFAKHFVFEENMINGEKVVGHSGVSAGEAEENLWKALLVVLVLLVAGLGSFLLKRKRRDWPQR